MAQAEFSLKGRDQKRLMKDRLVRLAVTAGGVSVLGALVLIFLYLVMVAMPLFSDARLDTAISSQTVPHAEPVSMSIDEYGENVFLLNRNGSAQFWPVTGQKSQPVKQLSIPLKIELFSTMPASEGWFAVGERNGKVSVARPLFSYHIDQDGRHFSPELEFLPLPGDFRLTKGMVPVQTLTFAVTKEEFFFAAYDEQQQITVRWGKRNQPEQAVRSYVFPAHFPNLDQMMLTPDGQTLLARTGNDLVVAVLRGDHYETREVVDLSQGNAQHRVKGMTLLAGAHSVLVSHNDGHISQWFDVLKEGQRRLTFIRDFQLAADIQILLPETYRKGFYAFYPNGTVQSYATTSEKLVLFKRAFQTAPKLAALSDNEIYLATFSDDRVTLSKVDNPHPKVSLSSLWQKVWYESYPEPQYVWQSTSASDEFEPKLSLIPIAFGTLKAAVYAMLFAVPVAILGAIYTAYFMSPRMRRVVKPSIELMEALPTVIIGFLAGLWFAPIVESHLISMILLLVILPASTLVVGALWHLLPGSWVRRFSSGWHALILIPAMVLVMTVALSYSGELEAWLFNGDVRVFLAQQGIDFDQRSALVVGFAMGFAVIPTIFTIAEDAIFSVPKHLSDGSLALGATPWQTLTHVVLLTASPGIFSAVMMGLGRAVGETMIVLMATGNTPIMDWNIFEGMRTLSATIAVELPESEVGSSHFRVLFLAALVLFVFTFMVNSLAEWVRQRLREKYRAL